ncbi:MAG: glycerophosphodiester phosphodiesterase [Acidobacteriota bacterium]
MPHPFFIAPRPLVFAHRGGSALAPENTLAAFDRGLASGADGLELDVRLSRDGVVVVHHDQTLERTTNLHGAVADRTAGELAAADAGYWFRPLDAGADGPAEANYPFRGAGHGVPTLAAVLGRYPDARVIVELKGDSEALARATVDVVRRADASDRVCVGGFRSGVLRAVRRVAPDLATSASREQVRWALYRSWVGWPAARPAYAGYQVPERAGHTRVVSRRFVERAHARDLGVQVWTVDGEEQAARLLRWGVDGLITDRPDVIVPFVRRMTTEARR